MTLTLLQRILSRYSRNPDDVMLLSIGEDVTNGQFNTLIDNIERELEKVVLRGVGRIAIALPHSPELLGAIAAIWKMGVSYVPLDPNWPLPKIENILSAAQCSALIHNNEDINKFKNLDIHRLALEGESYVHYSAMQNSKSNYSNPENEAYVLFTSGSTGKPKGVSVSQEALSFYFDSFMKTYSVPDEGLLVPFSLPPVFDAILTSIILVLGTKNIGVIFGKNELASLSTCLLLSRSASPVFLKTTPSQLRLINDFSKPEKIFNCGGIIVIGGEQLYFSDLLFLRNRGQFKFINEYGPTEATVGCITYEIKTDDPHEGVVPIGKPFPNVDVRFEEQEKSMPDKELVLGGPGIANGYVNDPNNDRFFNCNNVRYYKTGDYVSINKNGDFVFGGRVDDIVKHRGHRISLIEIENAVKEVYPQLHPVVLIHQDLLYVVIDKSVATISLSSLVKALSKTLPEHMLPDELLNLGSLPLTKNGKIDRTAIFDLINEGVIKQKYCSLELRALVSRLWADTLAIDTKQHQPTAAKANFFRSGGSSIDALKLSGRIGAEIGKKIPISLLFDFPEFEKFLEQVNLVITDKTLEQSKGTEKNDIEHFFTVADCQKAILAAEATSRLSGLYTVISATEITGTICAEKLADAIGETIRNNKIFNWVFSFDNNYNLIAEPSNIERKIDVPVQSISSYSTGKQTRYIQEQLKRLRYQNVDVYSPIISPITAGIYQLKDNKFVTFIHTHHVLVDEYSTELFWKEVVLRATNQVDEKFQRPSYRAFHSQDPKQINTTPLIVKRIIEATTSGEAINPIRSQGTPASHLAYDFQIESKLSEKLFDNNSTAIRTLNTILSIAAKFAIAKLLNRSKFLVNIPVTLRDTTSDFDTIGCYVINCPEILEVSSADRPVNDELDEWESIVTNLMTTGSDNHEEIHNGLRENLTHWDDMISVSMMIETLESKKTKGVKWRHLNTPVGPPKHDLMFSMNIDKANKKLSGVIRAKELFSDAALEASVDVFKIKLSEILNNTLLSKLELDDSVIAPSINVDQAQTEFLESSNSKVSKLAADICHISNEVLSVPLAPQSNFIKSGVRSLGLLRLSSAIERKMDFKVKVVDFYDFPSPQELAELIYSNSLDLLETEYGK